MASKQFALDERTTITVYKRKTSRNLRLSVSADGKIRVSIPVWAPYRAGVAFAQKRRDWIEQQRKPQAVLASGQAVGKAHQLQFVQNSAIDALKSSVRSTEVIVRVPETVNVTDVEVQEVARKACIRALRTEAQQLLPQRLETLAKQHGFEYQSVAIKQLRSRWGSCDQRGHIVLNLYLMQLPWESIDYVLLHELTHTKYLHHGPVFWGAMEEVLPDVKQRRAAMRSHQPILNAPLAQV